MMTKKTQKKLRWKSILKKSAVGEGLHRSSFQIRFSPYLRRKCTKVETGTSSSKKILLSQSTHDWKRLDH